MTEEAFTQFLPKVLPDVQKALHAICVGNEVGHAFDLDSSSGKNSHTMIMMILPKAAAEEMMAAFKSEIIRARQQARPSASPVN